jgi:DNA-binding winged helix-turn-helix (wHTH) protein
MIDATRTHRLRFALLVIATLLLLPTLAGAKPKVLSKATLWKNVVRCNVAKVEKVLTTHVFDLRTNAVDVG